jgi:hypothetical protein
MDILPKAASESPPTPQRDWRQLKGIVSLNSAFENADSQSTAGTGNLGGKNRFLPKEINANWFF